MQHHERQLSEVRQPDDLRGGIGHDIERPHWAGEVGVLTIGRTHVLNPPSLMVLVEIEAMLVDVHILAKIGAYGGQILLYDSEHCSLSVAIKGVVEDGQ